MDRLSNLPEHILLHILSFLTTKEAVSTSVLSKPWQHLWTLVPAIDLDDIGYQGRQTFDGIVSKVLDGNKAPIIRRFRLEGHFSTSSLDKWVSSATQSNAEELDLTVYDSSRGGPSIYAFCCAHESRKTLVIMKLIIRLRSCDDVHKQFVIGGHLDFPALKVLHINTVGFESQDASLSGFFASQFPLLEELVVQHPTIHHDINISLPVLRSFQIHAYHSRPVRKYILNLEAPSLQYLVLRTFGSAGFRVEHLPNLVEANVDVFYNMQEEGKYEEYGESLINFVNALSNVRRLILSLSTMKALTDLSFVLTDRIQSFHNLVELDLQLHGSVLCITMVMLSKFKNLVHLKVTTKDGPYNRSEYTPPAHVPNCLTYHLKTFCFRYFQGSKYEIEFAIYILKNSLVLENAKIRFGHRLTWTTGHDCHTILSTTSKGSSDCQLEFDQISELEHRNLKDGYDYYDSE